MLGSAVCIPALTLYASPAGAAPSLLLLLGVLYALPAALLMNVYITGLNQLLDIEIDRVNKPDLPLASGELSPLAGSLLVAGALCLSLVLGWGHPLLSTRALRCTLLGSAVLGTLYSAPPVRLKRFPLLASGCIITVRCVRARQAPELSARPCHSCRCRPCHPRRCCAAAAVAVARRAGVRLVRRSLPPVAATTAPCSLRASPRHRALPAGPLLLSPLTCARSPPGLAQRRSDQLGLLCARGDHRGRRGGLAAVGGARLAVAAAALLGAGWLL